MASCLPYGPAAFAADPFHDAGSVLASALPEFLGALGAALVIALVTAALHRLRRRRTARRKRATPQ